MNRAAAIALAVIAPVLAARAADPPPFVYPAMPERMSVERILRLEVEAPDDAPAYEYLWWTKRDALDWTVARTWHADPWFVFVPAEPGEYSIQVDARPVGAGEPVTKKWLGTVRVHSSIESAGPPPLVDRITLAPRAQALPTGVPIGFYVHPHFGVPLEGLEFRLWELGPDRVVRDWAPWPLPDYVAETARNVGLQVDVRERGRPATTQMFWLGDFHFSASTAPPDVPLLRALVADDFERFAEDEALDVLAGELALAIDLLRLEFEGATLADQIAALEATPRVTAVEPSGDGARVTLEGAGAYAIDLTARTLRQDGSPVTVAIDGASFPRYPQVFAALRGHSASAQRAAAITFALAEGYLAGPVDHYVLRTPSETISHCGAASLQLVRIMRRCGQPIEFVGIDQPDGGPHLLTQIDLGDGASMMLDPLIGDVYEYQARDLGRRPVPAPLDLPNLRDIPSLDLRRLDVPGATVTIYADFEPGVLFVRPRAGAPMTQFERPADDEGADG